MPTNAIITVVIGLVMLFLIITLVSTGFLGAAKAFLTQSRAATAPSASSITPITINFDKKPLQGEESMARVALYNDGPEASDVALAFSCPPGVLDVIAMTPKSIAARDQASYIVVVRVPLDAPPGVHLCTITATAENGSGAVIATSDLPITLG
jgi:hypothetical protein